MFEVNAERKQRKESSVGMKALEVGGVQRTGKENKNSTKRINLTLYMAFKYKFQ